MTERTTPTDARGDTAPGIHDRQVIGGPPSPATARGLVRWVLGAQRWRIAAGASAGIIWMGATAALPIALGAAVDNAVEPAQNASTSTVLSWAALLVAVAAAIAVAGAVRHRLAVSLFAGTRWRLERHVTSRVLDHRGGDLPDAGTLLAASQNDARAVGGIADLMCRGSGAVVSLIGVGAVMLTTSPLLGVVVLVGLPLSMLSLVPIWRPYTRRAAAVQATMADASATSADLIGGLRTVRGLSMDSSARRWFARSVRDVEEAGVAAARIGAVWQVISLTVPGLFLALVLLIGGNLTIDGSINAGDLVTFSGLTAFLAIPLQTLAEVGDVWARGLAGARRIADVLNAPMAVEPIPTDPSIEAPATPMRIELHGAPASPIDGIDLIAEGTLLGIRNENDDVTETLLDVLGRRVPADGHRFELNGVAAGAQHPADVRRAVLVEDARRPWLLAGSLLDNTTINAALGAHPDRTHVARLALHTAGLDEYLDRMDHDVGEGGQRLSGGQRQRAALARAVAAAPPVLVLVEPTNALDSATEMVVTERLAAARNGLTTIVITASPIVLAACDVVIVPQHRLGVTR
ncbi:MAG: ABC transporter ATP-binding protein [Actinomycetota bacterium]